MNWLLRYEATRREEADEASKKKYGPVSVAASCTKQGAPTSSDDVLQHARRDSDRHRAINRLYGTCPCSIQRRGGQHPSIGALM